jgi:hypothetical protein
MKKALILQGKSQEEKDVCWIYWSCFASNNAEEGEFDVNKMHILRSVLVIEYLTNNVFFKKRNKVQN